MKKASAIFIHYAVLCTSLSDHRLSGVYRSSTYENSAVESIRRGAITIFGSTAFCIISSLTTSKMYLILLGNIEDNVSIRRKCHAEERHWRRLRIEYDRQSAFRRNPASTCNVEDEDWVRRVFVM